MAGERIDKRTSLLGAFGIQFFSRYASVALQILLTAVLARLLTPKEFGTVAIISVFISFFAIFADLGIGPAIVQFDDLTSEDYNTLFGFSIILGIILMLLFCCLAWPISVVYRDPSLVTLCCASAPSIFFSALNMVPNGVMLQRREFRSMGIRLVVSTAISGVVGILVALAGLGGFALVLQESTLLFVTFVWNGIHIRIRPKWTGMKAVVSRIARYSGFQSAFQFVNYFSRNLDNLLVGAFMGPANLGYYDKAYKLMQMPNVYLTGILSSVLQPYLVDYSHHPDKMYSFWIKMSKLLALIGLWAMLICFFCAPEIVEVLYGPQWRPAIPVFQALSLSIAVQMINSTGGAVLQSLEHTDYLFKSGLINAGITSVLILVGVAGIKELSGLGVCVTIAYFAHACTNVYFIACRGMHKHMITTVQEFLPLLAAGASSGLMVWFVVGFMPDLGLMLSILAKGMVITVLLGGAVAIVGELDSVRFLSLMRAMGKEDAR